MIVHPIPSRPPRFQLPAFAGLTGDRLAATMGRRLDDGYHYFRDVRPGAAGRIGTVVVGPGGTWTLHRAELRDRYRKRNGHWYRWNGSTGSWVPWDAMDVNEARLAGHRLELYLERATLPAIVQACLVVAGGGQVSWEPDQRPGVQVFDEVERLAARITRDEVLTAAQVDRIVALLDPRQPLPRLAPSIGG